MPRVTIDSSLEPRQLPVENGIIVTDVKHQFMSLIHNAYIYHRIPTITPDDVWLTILQYLAKNVNENEFHYRVMFGLGEGQKEIRIERQTIDFNDVDCIENIFHEFVEKMEVENSTIKDFECDFSTSTPITRLCSQVSLSHMMKKFFALRMVQLCGFPAIDFEGTEDDWKKIITKISAFKKIGHDSIQKYLDKCTSVVEKILTVFDPSQTVDWTKFYYSKLCGSGSQIGYNGFILDILNVRIGEAWEPSELSSMRTEYKFIFENRLTGITKDLCIDSGPLPIDDSFRMKYDYKIKDYITPYTINGKNLSFKDIDWTQIEQISFKGEKIIDYFARELKTDKFRIKKSGDVIKVEYMERCDELTIKRWGTNFDKDCEYTLYTSEYLVDEFDFERHMSFWTSAPKPWQDLYNSIPEELEKD